MNHDVTSITLDIPSIFLRYSPDRTERFLSIILNVINQSHGSAIDGYAPYRMVERVGRQERGLIHDLVILHFQSGHGVDCVHHTLLYVGDCCSGLFCPVERFEQRAGYGECCLFLVSRQSFVA